ncbi:MAG: Tol-Pal system protein TolB [Alphaproteobacteria bacterium]|nr:Tol-Pal system protein TolB [Alphaproteobacteria bacterium]
MISTIKKIFVVCCFCLSSFCFAEGERVVVNVNEGVMKAIKIALHLHGNGYDKKSPVIQRFLEVVQNDLQSTFLFKAIPNAAFMQYLKGVDSEPAYALWRTINAQYLMNAEITIANEQLTVKFVLYDILSERPISTFSVSGSASEWRKAAHMVANGVYERIIGEKGYFDTKILYVDIQKSRRGIRRHRLAMMDYDGHNVQYITNGNTMVLTPRFSPKGDEFCFFAYKEKIVNGRRIPLSGSVYRYNLHTKKTQLIAQFKGMTYAPRYSPDGNSMIFSLSKHGSSSIYRLDLITKKVTKLTKGRCIDTSPCYSPDGKYIVFNSDRGGTPQLYIMEADGSNIRRLSFGKGRYATPVWSPRGDWIAFTRFGAEGFFIGVIHPDGTGERMLAAGYLVESPSWSPNGRVVMFANQNPGRIDQLYSVDITGYNKHIIKTPGNAIDPEWSAKTGMR